MRRGDESVNGLDPEGVHWIRGFLRLLADANVSELTNPASGRISLEQAYLTLTREAVDYRTPDGSRER